MRTENYSIRLWDPEIQNKLHTLHTRLLYPTPFFSTNKITKFPHGKEDRNLKKQNLDDIFVGWGGNKIKLWQEEKKGMKIFWENVFNRLPFKLALKSE